jgi:hypothetical protein
MTSTDLWTIIYSDQKYRSYCQAMKGEDAAKYMKLAGDRINELHAFHQVPFTDIYGNLFHWETRLPMQN